MQLVIGTFLAPRLTKFVQQEKERLGIKDDDDEDDKKKGNDRGGGENDEENAIAEGNTMTETQVDTTRGEGTEE